MLKINDKNKTQLQNSYASLPQESINLIWTVACTALLSYFEFIVLVRKLK